MVDKYTIRFKLNTPYSGFPDVFCTRQARIVPKDAADKLTTAPHRHRPLQVQVLHSRRQGGAGEK